MTLLLLLLLAAPLRGQDTVEGKAVQEAPSQAKILAKMKETLAHDSGAADKLAERIARSSLSMKITPEEDPARAALVIRSWIAADPESAAQVAVGLAQDDAERSTRFQDLVNRTVRTHFDFNPESNKGIFGNLRKSSGESKLLTKQAKMTEEEKREILKTMFEGQGGQSGKVITQEDAGKEPATGVGGAGQDYFDRLSQANLRGYSPQLMAMQSALNARRPPGAPKLIESGKLDYATLSYPAHGMRFDVENLSARLAYQLNYQLARALGLERNYTQEQLADPALEAQLRAKGAAKGLSPRFDRRAEALAKARAALAGFDRAAQAAQNPDKITKALLMTLGGRQKEAARWITAASLEEELQRLESEEGFLTPELLALIEACPLPEGTRKAYAARGGSYKDRLLKMKANASSALAALTSDAWASSIDSIDRSLAENGRLRKDLFRDIQDLVNTPYRLGALATNRPRWRQLLDDMLLRYLPSLGYSKQLQRQAGQKALLSDVYVKIAAGETDAAHAILAAYEPNQAPPSKR